MTIYVFIFGITIFLFYIFEKSGWSNKEQTTRYRLAFCTIGFAGVFLPLILFYGLRIDVGLDYHSYIRIYNEIKKIPLMEYAQAYFERRQDVEIAYYLINRITYLIFDDVHLMFFLTGVIMFGIVFAAIIKYNDISYPYAVFIFLMVEFAVATNNVRSTLACCIMLYGFYYIIKNKPIQYLICVLISSLFHQSAICCLFFWLLKDFKSIRLNKIRNYVWYIIVFATPLFARIGIFIAKQIPLFEKYFDWYWVNMNSGSAMFLWRCLPAIVGIRLLVKYYKIDLGKYKVLLNIQLCRIPFLYSGYIMGPATRMDRLAWVSEIILVPYVIRKIERTKDRTLAYIVFAVWYIFIFVMYNVVQNGSDIFPYRSIIMELLV